MHVLHALKLGQTQLLNYMLISITPYTKAINMHILSMPFLIIKVHWMFLRILLFLQLLVHQKTWQVF